MLYWMQKIMKILLKFGDILTEIDGILRRGVPGEEAEPASPRRRRPASSAASAPAGRRRARPPSREARRRRRSAGA